MTSKRTIARVVLPLCVAVAAAIALHWPSAAQPGGDAPHSAGAREVHVPVLDTFADDGSLCPVELIIQSVGAQPSKAVVVFWGAPDPSFDGEAGPLFVQCTGLIAPGQTWRMAGPMIRTGARSATVYSATTERLSEIDVDLGFDDIVADFLCETLYVSVIGDAEQALRFRRAVRDGGSYGGLPMDRVLGAPLTVLVDRECDGGSLRYAGVSSAEALEGPSAPSELYQYSIPFLGASLERLGPPRITAMNVGLAHASVEVFAGLNLIGASPEPAPLPADCPLRASCGSFSVEPGESVVFDPVAAGCLDGDGSGWLESDQPLVVIVDGFGLEPGERASTAALLVNAGGTAAGTGSGAVAPLADDGIDRLSAPLVYHDYRGWSTIIHIANNSTREVGARIYIKDRLGHLVNGDDFAICPLGGRNVRLGAGDGIELPPNFVGSVSIESFGVATGAEPDVLSVTVELVRSDEAGESVAAAAYEILPAESGENLVGVPSLGGGLDGSSTLAVHNRVTSSGFTDYAVFLFDESGLIDYICFKLNESQVEYIDLSTMGYVMPSFRGSAVISATFWEHDLFDDRGRFVRNQVSLGAVVIEAPKETSATVTSPAIPEGPTKAVMLPPVESDFGVASAPIDLPICAPLSIRPSIDRTTRIYLPRAVHGESVPAEPEPIFP